MFFLVPETALYRYGPGYPRPQGQTGMGSMSTIRSITISCVNVRNEVGFFLK